VRLGVFFRKFPNPSGRQRVKRYASRKHAARPMREIIATGDYIKVIFPKSNRRFLLIYES